MGFLRLKPFGLVPPANWNTALWPSTKKWSARSISIRCSLPQAQDMKSKADLVGDNARSLAESVLHRILEAAVLASTEYAVKRQFANVKGIALVAIMAAVGVVLAGLFVLARKTRHQRKVKTLSGRTRRPAVPREFESLRRSTRCPFARAARLVGCSLAGRGTLDRRIRRLVPFLLRMTNEGREKRLDGFILQVPSQGFATDLGTFSKTVNRTLRVLATHDPTGGDCFATRDVVADDWQFSFNGTRFFVTTFAPFYGPWHSRYSGRKDSAFIYFQPEYSFDHHGISAANPDRERLKERVRRAFKEGGVGYSIALVRQPIEAYKYVKPLKVGDPPVEWWNAN
jgi:hypothetical protein